jgi:hypothetical protein
MTVRGARPERVAALKVEASETHSVLVCAECGCSDDERAAGWRGYREDLPDEDEQPSPHRAAKSTATSTSASASFP